MRTHPSYHALMSEATAAGLHGTPWADGVHTSPHVLRAAGFMLFTELEPAVLCPISMTYAAQRQAFGKRLIEQPLMRNVLADLAVESEAACALSIRLARAFDHKNDAHEQVVARLLTPIAKFWICKCGSHFAQESMECLGGNWGHTFGTLGSQTDFDAILQRAIPK